jgi:hypothetical protein
MTREEAIEILQGAIKKPNTKDGYLGQAIDMAIKALEQKPALEKTIAEITELRDSYEKDNYHDESERITKRAIKKCVPKWKDRLGQNPRKVIYEGDGYSDGELTVDHAYCPNCDHETEVDSENWGCSYCPECGQRLDWEMEQEE